MLPLARARMANRAGARAAAQRRSHPAQSIWTDSNARHQTFQTETDWRTAAGEQPLAATDCVQPLKNARRHTPTALMDSAVLFRLGT